jgi:hypothetical protein
MIPGAYLTFFSTTTGVVMQTSFKSAQYLLALLASSATIASAQQGLSTNIKFGKLEDLDKCAQVYRYDTGACMEPLENYAKGKNPKQLFEIGKRARLHFTHWAALRFFEPAVAKSPSAEQCADEDLGLAVVSGLGLPADRPDKLRADRIFSGACHAAIKPRIEKELASKSGGYLAQHACAVLAAKGDKNAACAPKAEPVAAAPDAPAPIPKVDLKTAQFGLVKVYAGPEGERVAVADIPAHKGAYAVRVTGVRSKINDRTFVHLEMPNNNGADYVAEIDGNRWNTLTSRGGGWILYAPTVRNDIRLVYSEKDTKAFDKELLRK